MTANSPVRVVILGCGTVGGGLVELLRSKRQAVERAAGRPLVLAGVGVRDARRARAGIESTLLSEDLEALALDPQVDLVVELIGGRDRAVSLMERALLAGKDVVTANKAALAFEGARLFDARDRGCGRLRFEAAVAGGIPIIRSMRQGLVGNRFRLLAGILNGTCNYILTRIEEQGLDYRDALREAQQLGFAEADPALDVEGHDAAQKLALLVTLATGARVPVSSITVEGIARLGPPDFEHAREIGRAIRLIALARSTPRGWELSVAPMLLPAHQALAHIRGEMNAIYLDGDVVGPMLFSGRGAGRLPTAGAVLSDIVDLARTRGTPRLARPRADATPDPPPQLTGNDDRLLPHYLRVTVRDEPGILSAITGVFGDARVSIATLRQEKPPPDRHATLRLTTHPAGAAALRAVTETLEERGLALQPVTRIRFEDLG